MVIRPVFTMSMYNSCVVILCGPNDKRIRRIGVIIMVNLKVNISVTI